MAMDSAAIVAYFENLCRTEDVAVAIAAIRTQLWVLKEGCTGVSTVTELRKVLTQGAEAMASTQTSVWSVRSGCELFLRFITYTKLLHDPDFDKCRTGLIERGDQFLHRLNLSRDRIADKFISLFPQTKQRVLLHGRSRIVRYVLEQASRTRCMSCLVTESQPDCAGRRMCVELRSAGIECEVITDTAVGYVMERIDLVIFGAEAVVQTGGVVNKIGTATIAMCAKAQNKPVWVVAESFKLLKESPLCQSDLPQRLVCPAYSEEAGELEEHPRVDYTSPKFWDTIITDLGITNPAGIALDIMKLYL